MVTSEVCFLFVFISYMFGAFVGDAVATYKTKRKGKRRNSNHKRRHVKKAARSHSKDEHKAFQKYLKKIREEYSAAELTRLLAQYRADGYASNRYRLRPQSEGSSTATVKAPARPKNARTKTSKAAGS